MKVVILQPAYLPWLGFFDRIDEAAICVILDNVHLDTNSKTRFTNRNKIRTKNGDLWLSLPMVTKGGYQKFHINEIALVQDKWPKKHWKSIEMSYNKANFFHDYKEIINSWYLKKWSRMQDLLDFTTKDLLNILKIDTKIINSSSLEVNSEKSDLILDICKKTNAETYLSGPFGRSYLEQKEFKLNNIEVLFHDYNHPVYTQTYEGFSAYMSVIDLLFNQGSSSMSIIKKGRKFSKC